MGLGWDESPQRRGQTRRVVALARWRAGGFNGGMGRDVPGGSLGSPPTPANWDPTGHPVAWARTGSRQPERSDHQPSTPSIFAWPALSFFSFLHHPFTGTLEYRRTGFYDSRGSRPLSPFPFLLTVVVVFSALGSRFLIHPPLPVLCLTSSSLYLISLVLSISSYLSPSAVVRFLAPASVSVLPASTLPVLPPSSVSKSSVFRLFLRLGLSH